MARKLKGKVSSKGLKGALARYQESEQTKAKVKRKLEHESSKGKSSKQVNRNRKLQQENGKKFVPFLPDSTLLLVGEGDFSFAKSILDCGYVKAENLITTSYDSGVKELELKYPKSFRENYDYLVAQGVRIFFNIDATKLVSSFKLSKKNPWPKVVGPEWKGKSLENVLFNFPHTGHGIKDQDRNIREHQELLFGYFDSCKQLFQLANKKVGDDHLSGYEVGKEHFQEGIGRIILSLFAGEPYDSWQPKVLAKENGLRLERSNKFQWDTFPGYRHRRTNNEQDTTKPAAEREARIFIFEENDNKRHNQSKRASNDSDSE
ncbi:AaceriADL221Cp [[Ashbya] aceris (nom. inval.)]|nr:AaceriADL221Cp [[Ashbya] aceris (nom. inval.)]